MKTSEFKRIARLLKELYAELKVELQEAGVDLYSDEYDVLFKHGQEVIRERLLEKMGFTIEEYREAKALVEAAPKESSEVLNDIKEGIDAFRNTHIPSADEITDLAKGILPAPQVTQKTINKIVKETIIEKPTVIRETVVKNTIEKADTSEIEKRVAGLVERLDAMPNDFAENFEKNIDVLGMPDFRKLAMGLQAQIDEVRADITSEEAGDVDSVNGQTGTVVLDTGDIAEDGNLYFTSERAQDAVGGIVDTTLEYNDATPSLRRAALTGDVTAPAGSNATTLASVISAGGPTGSATVAPIITWDAKGRLTAVSSATITPAVGSVTGLGTGVATALGVNVGSAGAFVVNGGALGTPSSGTLTNVTGLPTAGLLNDAVTYAKIQNVTTDRLLGRDTAGSGDTEELTVGGGIEFTGSTGIQTSAFTGDVTKAAGGTALTIANDAVTYAKMQNISATSRILGRITSGAGDTEELTGANVRTITGLEAGGAGDIWVEKAGDTMTGNLIFSGSTLSIKGASTNTPDLGTTTLAEKLGNIYLGASNKDIFPDNDINGLWARVINWGFTPDEHWHQNTDELSWTGYASYTGFVTPGSIATTLSTYKTAHSAAAKAFRYRAAATGAAIALRCRVALTYQTSGGVMVDDGTGNADGNGADNFYRVYLTQAALGGPMTVVEQYRTGGGAVTTNVGPTMSYGEFVGVGLRTGGTRWTNWNAAPHTFGESQEYVQFTNGSPAFSWTPARVGLYSAYTLVDFGSKAMFDWYDEAVT